MFPELAWKIIIPASLSTVVAWITTAVVVRHGKAWGIIDDPSTHKLPKVVHEKPVPRGGGIPIITTLVIGAVLFMPHTTQTLGIVLAATILAITGFFDDKYPEMVSPYLRLGINTLAALLVVGVGIGIGYITNPLGGIIRLDQPQWCFAALGSKHCIWILSDLFAVIWLVGMQNIVGWSSGVDGQLPGFVVIAAIAVGLVGLRFGADQSQWPIIALAGITAGAYLGFLPWNWWPQKIMPGYGGKSLAGFLLGLLAIMSAAKVGTLLLVLGVPMIDGFLVIAKRISEKRSPVWGGYEHLHHYLLDRGWGKRRIALFYWTISGILAILAWQLQPPFKLYTMAAAILCLTGMLLWLRNWSE